MALDEREEVQEHLQDVDEGQDSNLDDRRMQVSGYRSRFRLVNELTGELPFALPHCSNTPTSSSSFNPSPDTSLLYVASSPSARSIPSSKPSCSPSMETNTSRVRSTCC